MIVLYLNNSDRKLNIININNKQIIVNIVINQLLMSQHKM